MSVTASHELVLKVNDSLSVKPLVDMMDSVQEFVLGLYHRPRRQFKIIVIEAAPVAVILIIIGIENHRFLKERILKDKRGIVRNTNVRAAQQVFDSQFLCQISGKRRKFLRNLRREFDKRVMLADKNIFIAKLLCKPVKINLVRRSGAGHMSAESRRVENNLFASCFRLI